MLILFRKWSYCCRTACVSHTSRTCEWERNEEGGKDLRLWLIFNLLVFFCCFCFFWWIEHCFCFSHLSIYCFVVDGERLFNTSITLLCSFCHVDGHERNIHTGEWLLQSLIGTAVAAHLARSLTIFLSIEFHFVSFVSHEHNKFDQNRIDTLNWYWMPDTRHIINRYKIWERTDDLVFFNFFFFF